MSASAQTRLARFCHRAGEPVPTDDAEREELAAALSRIVEDARAAHPTVPLDEERLLQCVLRHVGSAPTLLAALRRVRGGDLHLAQACLDGDRAAIEILEKILTGPIYNAISRMKLGSDFNDEVIQRLRVLLLVRDDRAKPTLQSFSGRGRLTSWLRLTAIRLANRLTRQQGGRPAAAEISSLGVLADPERDFLRRRYRNDLDLAVRESFAQLSTRQRNLLRQYFLDGLGVEDLGALYRVHNSTVSRWLAGVRATVRSGVRRDLKHRLSLGDSTIDSLLGSVENDLMTSVRQLLSAPGSAS